MNVNVSIRQVSPKSGNLSFEAVAKVNVGKSGELSDVSRDIANFAKGIVDLTEKNAKRGYANAVNGIKKSLPVELSLTSEGETITLVYRNFGKFVREATEANVRGFLKDNIEFTQRYHNFSQPKLKKVA